MSLVRYFYVSRSRAGLRPPEVHRLVGSSQVNNRRRNVTGLLAYSGPHFAQIIEGRRDDVEPLMQRIAADERHHDVRVLRVDEDIVNRDFGEWSMQLLESPATADWIEALLSTP
jgi:hypothetical protein